MLLAQGDGPNEERKNESHGSHAGIEDPHSGERESESVQDDIALILGKMRNKTLLGAGERVRDFRRRLRRESILERGDVLAKHVLVDDCAEDDGDGGGDLSDETERRGCGGHVARMNVGLESDEGGLEERAGSGTGDDLVDDEARPGRVGFEVDEKAETESHEDESCNYEFVVAAGDLDQDPGKGGRDG